MSFTRYGKGISHPNIAIMKYWGKKDLEENIPMNSSLSFTTTKLCTVTEIFESENDEFFLNGVKTEMKDRMVKLISIFKKKANYTLGIKIVSENNFPHGAGLASSASGFSALVIALNEYFGLNIKPKELSELARFGSGSAARSIFPGFVLFENTYARKVGDWEDLRIFVIINEKNEKKVGSTMAMIRTVNTSPLFSARIKNLPEKIELALKYIKDKNFEELSTLIMRESNEMHAVILDSWPPVFYLNDRSFEIIDLCIKYNESGVKVAYTFDAGPNAFIFTLEKYLDDAINFFKSNTQGEVYIAH